MQILLACHLEKAAVLIRRYYFSPLDLVCKVELGLQKEALFAGRLKKLPTSLLSSDNEIFQIRKPIPVWEKKATEAIHYVRFFRHRAFNYSHLAPMPGTCKPRRAVEVLYLALVLALLRPNAASNPFVLNTKHQSWRIWTIFSRETVCTHLWQSYVGMAVHQMGGNNSVFKGAPHCSHTTQPLAGPTQTKGPTDPTSHSRLL